MKNNYALSYATGGIVLVTLGSLTLWQLARLIPFIYDGLRVVLLVVAVITALVMLLSPKRELFEMWLFVWFLIGLGGVLAWN